MTHTRTYTLEERALEALCSQELVRIVATDAYGHVHAIRNATPGDPRSGEGQRTIEVIDVNGVETHHVALGHADVEWDADMPERPRQESIPDFPQEPPS